MALLALCDPATLLALCRTRRVVAPVSPVLLVLLLALVGGVISRWTRRDPPAAGG